MQEKNNFGSERCTKKIHTTVMNNLAKQGSGAYCFKRSDINTNRLLDHHGDKNTASFFMPFYLYPFFISHKFLHLRAGSELSVACSGVV